MPIILLLLSVVALAADPTCDIKELEKQCYASICSVATPGPIPYDEDTLNKELTKFNHTLPDSIESRRKKVEETVKAIVKRMKEATEDNSVEDIVERLITTEEVHFSRLEDLFKKEMRVRETKTGQQPIFSDMGDSLYPEFKKMINTYYELNRAFYSINNSELDSEIVKQAVKNLSEFNGKDYSKIIRDDEMKFRADYNRYMATKLSPYKKVLAQQLLNKMKNSLQENFLASNAKQDFYQSCKMAAYFHKKLAPFNQVVLDQMIKTSLDGYRKNFLPKLSKDTAATLALYFTKENIHLINYSNEYSFDDRIDPAGPGTTRDLISGMEFLQKTKNYGCELSIVNVEDHFNFETRKINISKFTLATGHEEALAHELGHFLSYLASNGELSGHSKKKLDGLRNCIQGFYPGTVPISQLPFPHSGDTQNTEEDFADFMAASVGVKVKPLTCDLQGLTLYTHKEYGELYNPLPTDVHSNGLFREIHMKMVKGEKLSQSCLDLMNNSAVKPVKCSL